MEEDAIAAAHHDFVLDEQSTASALDKIQNALERMPGAYAWMMVGEDVKTARVLTCNSAFIDIFQPAAPSGSNIQTPNISDWPTPEGNLKTVLSTLESVIKTGQPNDCNLLLTESSGQSHSIHLNFSRMSGPDDYPARLAVTAHETSESRRLELVARHATEMLRAMIDGVKEYAVFMLNTDRTIVSWNAGAARLTGQSGQDVVGKNVDVLKSVEQKDGINWEKLVDQTTLKTPARGEGWMTKRDGIFWGTVACHALVAQNSLRGYAVVIHDLTDKLASEAAIRDSEARFRDYAESASDWFWETDSNLQITHLSETFSDRLGMPIEDALGQAHFQLSDMTEMAEEWWAHLRSLKEHKHFRDFQYTVSVPDGRVVTISDSGKPVFDKNGDFIGYRGAGRDISQEIKAREAANTIAYRFFSAMDTASEAIILFDAQRRLVFWNKRTVSMLPELARYLRKGIRYSSILFALGTYTVAGSLSTPRKLRDIFNQSETADLTKEIQFSDGRYVRVSERDTEEGGITLVLSDTSEMVEREQKLRQRYKMEALGQLTGGVAHDFNNLLTVVSGNLEMVQPHVQDAPKLSKRIQNAIDAVSRGADLTGRLLGFARQAPAETQTVNISDQITTLLPLLRQAVGNSVTISHLIDDVGAIDVDASQFDNAVLNLCINARDAMPDGGTLSIVTEPVSKLPTVPEDMEIPFGLKWVAIRVKDTGLGMPKEVRERAFDPFFTTKEHGKGSGLGLSMVYGFVRRSKGLVDLDSTPGSGTTMSLYLPISPQNLTVDSQTSDAPAIPVIGNGHILLVEDNGPAREVIDAMLQDLGYSVTAVDSGAEAIHVLETGGPYDLILSDYTMPGGKTGLDVAHAARKSLGDVPILLMSGYTDIIPDPSKDGLENVQIVHKPFSLGRLSQLLKSAMDGPQQTIDL